MEDKIKISKINFNTIFQYEAGHLYWKVKPCKKICIGDKAGTYHTAGYWHITINKKKYLAHRLIFMMIHGYLPEYIDHINRIKHDNRIENLRAATSSENQRNRSAFYFSKSGIKNISWNKKAEAWRVSIRNAGKLLYLGQYKDIELAELIAFEARNKFHKEFAYHG